MSKNEELVLVVFDDGTVISYRKSKEKEGEQNTKKTVPL